MDVLLNVSDCEVDKTLQTVMILSIYMMVPSTNSATEEHTRDSSALLLQV